MNKLSVIVVAAASIGIATQVAPNKTTLSCSCHFWRSFSEKATLCKNIPHVITAKAWRVFQLLFARIAVASYPAITPCNKSLWLLLYPVQRHILSPLWHVILNMDVWHQYHRPFICWEFVHKNLLFMQAAWFLNNGFRLHYPSLPLLTSSASSRACQLKFQARWWQCMSTAWSPLIVKRIDPFSTLYLKMKSILFEL